MSDTMSTQHRFADVRKALNPNRIEEHRDLRRVLRYTVSDYSQVVDFKRIDVRVVEGARLESDFGERHQAIPKHLSAKLNQELTAKGCSLM
jgi:hypothetical protein